MRAQTVTPTKLPRKMVIRKMVMNLVKPSAAGSSTSLLCDLTNKSQVGQHVQYQQPDWVCLVNCR